MVLASFARLRLRDREMMLRIAESTPAILGQFAAVDITNFGLQSCCAFLQHFRAFCLFNILLALRGYDGRMRASLISNGTRHESLFGALFEGILVYLGYKRGNPILGNTHILQLQVLPCCLCSPGRGAQARVQPVCTRDRKAGFRNPLRSYMVMPFAVNCSEVFIRFP